MIAESAPNVKLGRSFGKFTTMAGWLAIVAPTLGGIFLERNLGTILLTSVLIYTTVAIVRALLLKETMHNNESDLTKNHEPKNFNTKVSLERQQMSKFSSFFSNLRLALHNRDLLGLTLAYSVYGVLFSQPSFLVTIYSTQEIHLNSFELGLMYSIFILLDSQLQIPFGMFADRWDKKKIIVLSWIGEMAFMMIFAYSVGPLFGLIAFAGWTVLGSLDNPAISALLTTVTKKETRGFAFGFFSTFSLLLAIPAPVLTGFLYAIRPSLPFFTLLSSNSIALVLFLLFMKPKQRAA